MEKRRQHFNPSAVQSESCQPWSGSEKVQPPFEIWRYMLLKSPEAGRVKSWKSHYRWNLRYLDELIASLEGGSDFIDLITC